MLASRERTLLALSRVTGVVSFTLVHYLSRDAWMEDAHMTFETDFPTVEQVLKSKYFLDEEWNAWHNQIVQESCLDKQRVKKVVEGTFAALSDLGNRTDHDDFVRIFNHASKIILKELNL